MAFTRQQIRTSCYWDLQNSMYGLLFRLSGQLLEAPSGWQFHWVLNEACEWLEATPSVLIASQNCHSKPQTNIWKHPHAPFQAIPTESLLESKSQSMQPTSKKVVDKKTEWPSSQFVQINEKPCLGWQSVSEKTNDGAIEQLNNWNIGADDLSTMDSWSETQLEDGFLAKEIFRFRVTNSFTGPGAPNKDKAATPEPQKSPNGPD